MNHLKYYMDECWNAIFNNGVMSLISITVIAVSMFIFSFFVAGVFNMDYVAKNLESNLEISVYLKEDISQDDKLDLDSKITGINGVSKVNFIDREASFDRLKQNLEAEKEGASSNLDIQNPLPDSYQVFVNAPSSIGDIANEIEEMDGVENVAYGKNIIQNVVAFASVVHLVSMSIMVILFLATLVIISNTTRLSVHARKTEIEIMKYIGAEDSMVTMPFVLEGAVLGFVGSIIGVVLFRIIFAVFLSKFEQTISFIELIPLFPFLTYVSLGIILLGILVGSIGSYLSVKRYTDI